MPKKNADLQPKTAIVTGGNRGIGRAIALRLARDGAGVVLCARDRDALDDTVKNIERLGGVAVAVAVDLRLPDSASQVVDRALAEFGRIDILINNAGATKRGDFEKLTEEDWADGFALKFFGAVRLTRSAWPHLRQHSGSVVNIAGVGGRTPGPQFAVGGSVNAALLSFTKALADVGVDDGVQVNAINPGPVRTERLDRRLAAEAAGKGIDVATAAEEFVRDAKINRFGDPEDIANLVSFVVSPGGRLLQGSIIDMDGGWTKTI
jgi:NAD(P)-dependent dehydrogenase (short-subunit alcohol dehydrogenase family)